MKRYGRLTAVFFWLGLFFYWVPQPFSAGDEQQEAQQGDKIPLTPKSVKVRVHLYFADPENLNLKAEERLLTPASDDVNDRAREVVNALIEGPRSSLGRTLPKETRLRSLFVTEDGVAYVDFDRNILEGHPKGVSSEILSIFSVVNTLALNFSEIQAVKILVEGREESTLAGHVELRFAFQPNLLMIK